MPAPGAITQIDTLLSPLVCETVGWAAKADDAPKLLEDVTVLLCREVVRQSSQPELPRLTSLKDLGLSAQEPSSLSGATTLFPWMAISSEFFQGVSQFNFLLRVSLLVEDVLSKWQQPSADLPGIIFERVVSIGDRSRGSRTRRELGLHFTPPTLARWLSSHLLDEVVSVNSVEALTILDPCLGGGAFWLASVRWARDKLQLSSSKLQEWPIDTLFGTDLSRISGEIATLSLRLELGTALSFHHAMLRQFRSVDAFNSAEFPTWKSNWAVILGNPPWGSSSNPPKPCSEQNQADPKRPTVRKIDTFILRFLELAREGGHFGLVVPSKLLELERHKATREALLRNGLNCAFDLGNNFFPEITENAAIIAGSTQTTPSSLKLGHLKDNCSPGEIVQETTLNITSSSNKTLRPPLRRLDTLKGYCRLDELVTVNDSGVDYSTSQMGKLILYQQEAPASTRDLATLRGRDIHPFQVNDSQTWLRHDWRERRDKLRSTHPKVKAKVNEAIYRSSPKILVRQTGSSLIAAIDWKGVAHQRSLLALVSQDTETLQVILLILNHPQTNQSLLRLSHQAGRDFAQLKVSILRALPIPRWDNDELQALRDKLEQDLSQRIPINERYVALANEWVEELYRRRGSILKA